MKIASLAAALMLAATAAQAAPCATDKGKTPEQSANAGSSASDKSTKNTAGGDQPSSPGTVGAMNNLGPNQGVTHQTSGDGGNKADPGAKKDPGAENTAGGKQPASPGTVGAMNNTVENQAGNKGDGC